MTKAFEIRLVARNEGLDYIDEHDIYRFNVAFMERLWRVFLPCSKGDDFRMHELTEEEASVILPRIKQYLESRRYFGIIGPTYPVIFERQEWLYPRSG